MSDVPGLNDRGLKWKEKIISKLDIDLVGKNG